MRASAHKWALWCLSTLSFKLQHIFIENQSNTDLLGDPSPFKSSLSARWLNVVVFQATAEPSGQGTADDNDPGCHAILTPVKDVPYENGSCQRGQKTGSNVKIARPREVGVWPDAVESHQSDNQDKTCKNVRIIFSELLSWISVAVGCGRPTPPSLSSPPIPTVIPTWSWGIFGHNGVCKDGVPGIETLCQA